TIRSPGRKSNAERAWENATVAFSTSAMFLGAAPTSCATRAYVSRTRGSASSAASYPPIAASRARCCMSASSTGRGMSPAPALFRWMRSRHPGVSRRQRSSSTGAEVSVCVTIDEKTGPYEPRAQARASPHQVPYHKPHIRRSLGEPPHVPRKPVRPVADEHAHCHALLCEGALRGGPDAVQHMHLVATRPVATREAERQRPVGEPRNEVQVVRSEHRPRPASRRKLEQASAQHGVGRIHVPLSRKRRRRRHVVRPLT